MEFCITYIDPTLSLAEMKPGFGAIHRKHVLRPGPLGPLLFASQVKAAKWIAKHGDDSICYTIDPWHDLKGRFS